MDNFLKEINYQLSKKKLGNPSRLINIHKIYMEGDSKAHVQYLYAVPYSKRIRNKKSTALSLFPKELTFKETE